MYAVCLYISFQPLFKQIYLGIEIEDVKYILQCVNMIVSLIVLFYTLSRVLHWRFGFPKYNDLISEQIVYT